MHQLAGKVAIITGASSGIGYETAKLFAREGARLVLVARRQAELDKLVADIEAMGTHAAALAGDVRDDALAHAAVATALDRFGGLDIAFNNAGMTGDATPVHKSRPTPGARSWTPTSPAPFSARATRFPPCSNAAAAR